jgi:hypothetical protein
MKIKKNNFYVFSVKQNDGLQGYDGNGKREPIAAVDLIFYHKGEDMETDIECRLCTELEKEYWLDSMEISDEIIPDMDFGAVSLCDFEDWKKEKGYVD